MGMRVVWRILGIKGIFFGISNGSYFLVVWKFDKRLSTELSVNKYCCCRVGLEGNYYIRTYTIIGWSE